LTGRTRGPLGVGLFVLAFGLAGLAAASAPGRDHAASRERVATAPWIPFGIASQPAPKQSTLPPYLAGAPAPPGYRLVWSDEFNGSSLDSSRWNVRDDQNYGASLDVDQCYRAGNTSVAGGELLLQVRRQTVACGGTNPDTGDHTYFVSAGLVVACLHLR